MANQVEIKITADPSSAEAGFKKVKSGFQSVKDSIVKNRKAIGLSIAALGVGLEGVAKSQAGLTESSRKLANATGMSEQEIRGMATSLSNATFPLDSALQLMTLGAQQGLDSADALKQYAAFWDTVGDATGLSAEALAKSGAALAAVGIEVGNESELLGAFGLITQESTQTVQDFLRGIHLLAPEMAAMGISVDEAAVIMTAMERELGLTARTARTQFKEALEQSETGLAGVLAQLGLSETQLDTYKGKLADSTGVIQANAEAHAGTKTVLDKLKSSLSDVVFQNGALIEKASMLAPVFMAAGPIIAAFGPITATAMNIASIGVRGFGLAVKLAMGPAGLVILAIGAAIAIGVLLWKNWDTIKAKAVAIFGAIADFFTKIWNKITGIFKDNWEKILLIIFPAAGIAVLIAQNWGKIIDIVTGIWDKVKDTVKSAINFIIGAINGFIRGINNIKISIPGVKIPFAPDIPGFSIGLPNIPEIPTLARGGIVTRPTLAMLGERGPEAVVPLGSGRGAGMTINLVINGDINGMDDFEAKVTSVIRDAVLGGGFSGVLARA